MTALPVRPFGSTGHESTRLIFGAAALGSMSPERAATTLDQVSAWGINHIDTAASYGASEDRLRPWLADHRDEVFLATKTGERNGAAARAELERSFERMGVDHIDLIQLHNLVDADEWETAFAPGGAVTALAAARDEGLVDHVGVTGHGLPVAERHLASLERFDFASVLFPYNVTMLDNPTYRSDVERLIEVGTERGVALQTIKSIARRRWRPDADRRFSWYEPLTDPESIAHAVRFVLGVDGLFLNTTSDARLLPAIVEAATGPLERPDDATMRTDVEREGIEPLFDDLHPVGI